MTIQDLGSIGEVIAAVATLATLIYLAAQVRQNTRALRSSTFQDIATQMAMNVEPLATTPDLSEIMLKGLEGTDNLSPPERFRFQSVMIMTFRRMEAVFIHSQLGSLDANLLEGFERSMLSILLTQGAATWWETAKVTFNPDFVAHVETWLQEHASDLSSVGEHPSLGFVVEPD